MNKRSIWAIGAGVLSIIVVTTLVDILLHIVKVYPDMDQPLTDGLAALATAYRVLISVAGAWLTAKLAPTDPLGHALKLGYVGIGLGTIGLIATWNAGLGPHWYPIALVVLAVPQCWAGGKLFVAMQAPQAR
jgi:hypothetical protein